MKLCWWSGDACYLLSLFHLERQGHQFVIRLMNSGQAHTSGLDTLHREHLIVDKNIKSIVTCSNKTE